MPTTYTAYDFAAGTNGNTTLAISFGLDFPVGSTPISVTALGAFLSANAAWTSSKVVTLYNTSTQAVLATATILATDVANSLATQVHQQVLKSITPVSVAAGTNCTIAVSGYGTDQFYNTAAANATNATDTGGGLISFIGTGRYASAGTGFPNTVAGSTSAATKPYDGGTLQFQGITPTAVPVTDANLFFSPYNWDVNGSTYAQSNNPGAYLKAGFTGTSVGLSVDVTPLTGASIASGNYPSISYSVDDGAATVVQLTSASTTLSLATGLASGNHTLYVEFVRGDFNQDRWTAPVMVLRVTGLVLDSGAATVAPTLRPGRMLLLGDSILETAYCLGATSPGGQDSTIGVAHGVAAARNAEFGVVGFAGQGYGQGGSGNVPALPSSYGLYSAGRSRLSSGLFSPAPDDVLAIEGTNGSTSTGTVTAFLASLRAAAPAAKLWLVVPFGGFARSAISAATLPDSRASLIDLGTDAQVGLTGTNNAVATREAAAGPHARATTLGQLGARLTSAMKAAESGSFANTLGGGFQ